MFSADVDEKFNKKVKNLWKTWKNSLSDTTVFSQKQKDLYSKHQIFEQWHLLIKKS